MSRNLGSGCEDSVVHALEWVCCWSLTCAAGALRGARLEGFGLVRQVFASIGTCGADFGLCVCWECCFAGVEELKMVLSPTRELAQQISNVLTDAGKPCDLLLLESLRESQEKNLGFSEGGFRSAGQYKDGHSQCLEPKPEDDLGTTSLGILYVSFTVCSMFASPVMRSLGSKRALVVGTTGYWLFIAEGLKPKQYTMFRASVYLGFTSSMIWVSRDQNLHRQQ
ncbi:hypothetical protein Droror1_Dr00006056 [Drosera rotundifolia]